MTLQCMISGSRLDEAPHMSEISENNPKHESSQLVRVLGFVILAHLWIPPPQTKHLLGGGGASLDPRQQSLLSRGKGELSRRRGNSDGLGYDLTACVRVLIVLSSLRRAASRTAMTR